MCLILDIAFAKNANAMKRMITKLSNIHGYTCKTFEFSCKCQASESEQLVTGIITFNAIPKKFMHLTFMPSFLSPWSYGFKDICKFREVVQYLIA